MANKRIPLEDRPIGWLLNTLQRVFNEWVRLDNADELGYVTCCTCSKRRKWNDRMDAGHCEKSTQQGTRFDPMNVAPQCSYCNRFQNGNQSAHRIYVDKKYGEGTADILRVKGKQRTDWDRFELVDQIKDYRKKVKQLKQEKDWIE